VFSLTKTAAAGCPVSPRQPAVTRCSTGSSASGTVIAST
jgi:hypothetical protein